MRIVAIRELTIPLQSKIRNAVVDFAEHTVSLVAVISDIVRGGRSVTGIAFDSIGRFAQGGLLRERLIARLMNVAPDGILDDSGCAFDPDKALRAIMRNEKPGGHGDRAHAAAAIELALWDLNAKLAGTPAWQLIGRKFGTSPLPRVPVYAAGGYYYPADGRGRLADEMRRYVDLGYRSFKMKVGGASLVEDMARVEAALDVVGDPACLAVDANGRFDLDAAHSFGAALAPLGLRWFEEPGDPLDFALLHTLSGSYGGALATGENLFSRRDVDNLIRYGGLRPSVDIFQMDPALSYGLGEYGLMVAALERGGFSRRQLYPHGGHMIALHIAAGLGLGGCEAYPDVFAPVGGYTPGCLIDEQGITPSEALGFGLEEKLELAPYIARISEA